MSPAPGRRWRAFGNGLRSLRGWRDASADVRDEIALHVELRAAELMAAGVPPHQARAQAAREAGDPARVAPLVANLAARTDRASSIRQRLDELAQDVKHALRGFRRTPGFTAIAVLTIALGLGANAAIFGVVNVAFFMPLPFDQDNSLVRVREYRVAPDGARLNVDASRRTADAIATRPDLFRSSVPIVFTGRALARDDGAIRVGTARVGAGFTSVINVSPVLGRSFTPAEERAGEGAGVVLISHGLWQTAFGGQPGILQQGVRLDGVPFSIVGVLPPNFHVPYESDVWMPARFGDNERGIFLLARLAGGVTLEQARGELEPMGQALARQYPDVMRGLGVTVVSAREYFVDDQDRVALVLMCAVGVLLLISCANVALLLTTRFAARRKEVAVRAALGCGRGRQLRQFMTEGLLLFLAGGLVGLLLAAWLRDALTVFLPEVIATQVGIQGIPFDARVIGFAAAVSVAAGVAFGAMAALRAARADLNGVIKGGGRSVASAGSRGLLGTLVIAEVALALVLLTAAGVMLEAFRSQRNRDLGVRPDGVITARFDLTAERYESPEARRAFVARMLERVRALPQVRSAGVTTSNPFCCGNWGLRVTPEGHAAATEGATPVVQHFIVTPGYFEAMGQPVRFGRAFTGLDVPGSEMTVVIDAAFAERFWPGQNAIGKRIKRGTLDQPFPWLTVVGVVDSVVEQGDFYTESVYLPHAQHADSAAAESVHLMARASGDPAGVGPALRSIAAGMDPNLALYDMAMLGDLIAQNLRQDRLGALVTAIFAGAGLLLAALGLYGVLSFVVGQDTKEIGVRLALGAPRRAVLGLVLGRAWRMTAIGLALGTAASWMAARLFSSIVADAAFNPGMMAASAAVLMAAALLAALGPARRALRFDPLDALRSD